MLFPISRGFIYHGQACSFYLYIVPLYTVKQYPTLTIPGPLDNVFDTT